MRILVAEDDAVTRKILAATLERLGWEVITASDGTAAWDTLETLGGENAPELVLLDVMMPGMDGIEICRKLRSERKSTGTSGTAIRSATIIRMAFPVNLCRPSLWRLSRTAITS